MNMYLNIILIILLIAVLSWREVQILIDRGSWKAEDYHKLFWYTEHNSMWKDWDSFHFASGLAVLIICIIITTPDAVFQIYIINQFWTIIANIVLYWLAIPVATQTVTISKVVLCGIICSISCI